MRKEAYAARVRERNTGNTCPRCGKLIDGSTCVDDEELPEVPQPKPGDVSICTYCGAMCLFDEQLRSRLMTRAQRRRIERDPRAKELMKIVEQISAGYRRRIQ